MYEPLDAQSPQAALWIGMILSLAAIIVVIHARWRINRYQRMAEHHDERYEGADARYEGADRGMDAKRETFAGLAILVIAVGAFVYSIYGYNHLDTVINDNVQEKYDVEHVESDGWIGNVVVAEVTTPDGTVHDDVRIYFDPDTGEPEITTEVPGLTDGSDDSGESE